jgi:hypothetical protein
LFHLYRVVDANYSHICFEKDHLIDLFEVVDFLDLSVMGLAVNNLGRLLVEHVNLGGILSVIPNFMLNQI